MSNEIEKTVENLLIEFDIKGSISIEYMGVSKKLDGNPMDQWRVIFNTGKTYEEFEYFTGFGHRKTIRGFAACGKPNAKFIRGNWEVSKPQTPHIAGVLYSLLLDSNVQYESFSEWCANYGYSDDSIKAETIYRACHQIAMQLKSIFTREQIQKLNEALQDY